MLKIKLTWTEVFVIVCLVMLCSAQLLGYSARRHSLMPPRAGPTEGFTGTSACAAVTVLNRGSVQHGGRRMEILMTVRKIASICTMVSFSSHKWVLSRPPRLTCVWISLLTGLAQQLTLTDKQPCHDMAAQPQKVCVRDYRRSRSLETWLNGLYSIFGR